MVDKDLPERGGIFPPHNATHPQKETSALSAPHAAAGCRAVAAGSDRRAQQCSYGVVQAVLGRGGTHQGAVLVSSASPGAGYCSPNPPLLFG